MPIPFEGCVPAPGTDHATWVTDALRDREGVAFMVPDRFERCVRVHHALNDGHTWAEVAPELLRRGAEAHGYPFAPEVEDVSDGLGEVAVDRLVDILGPAGREAQGCHFALWTGWGDLHPGSNTIVYKPEMRRIWDRLVVSFRARRAEREWVRRAGPAYGFVNSCPQVEWWGGREMWLFDGSLAAVRTIGSVHLWLDDEIRRRGPQWWWPADRSWFVANEIDDPWTYVAGSSGLVEAVLGDDGLETVEVRFGDLW